MKKLLGLVAVLALLGGLGTPVAAAASTASSGTVTMSAQVQAPRGFSMRQKFAREITRYGDSDSSPRSIDHVRELQYRLSWAGTFHVGVTGNFGPITRQAVKRFQKREGLRVTGVANHKTWAHLIHDTIRHRQAIPQRCKSKGWHACYDRSMHQVTLWHSGDLRNAWLVRGGAIGYETRVGNHQVYYRNIDHVSSLYGSAMPYSQFFNGGQAFHGSPFMVDPFYDHSHGCVNMYIEDARQLWKITSTKRLAVSVYGAWD